MNVDDTIFADTEPRIQTAFAGISALGRRAINLDEKRSIGHCGLRNPSRAANSEFRQKNETVFAKIKCLLAKVHSGAMDNPVANLRLSFSSRPAESRPVRSPQFKPVEISQRIS